MERPNEYLAVPAPLPRYLQACSLLRLCLVALFLAPSAAHAQMVFRISSYNQVWSNANFTTLYGTSTFIDQSTGCGHAGYSTVTMVVTPDGRQFYGSGYLSANTSGPTNGVGGTYTDVGTLHFNCSCVGSVGAGGQDQACLGRLQSQRPLTAQLPSSSGAPGRPDASRLPGPCPRDSRGLQQSRAQPTAVEVSSAIAMPLHGSRR